MSRVRYRCVVIPFTSFCELPGDDHFTFVPAVVLVYHPSCAIARLSKNINMWIQHNGASPHFIHAVRDNLDQNFG